MMKKIIIGIILLSMIFLVGCNQEKQYCLDNNMTFEDRYILQPNWTRCCKELIPTDYGTYRTDCESYQFNKVKENETEETNKSNYVNVTNLTANMAQITLSWTNTLTIQCGYTENLTLMNGNKTKFLNLTEFCEEIT